MLTSAPPRASVNVQGFARWFAGANVRRLLVAGSATLIRSASVHVLVMGTEAGRLLVRVP
jgi:hypothetical protein